MGKVSLFCVLLVFALLLEDGSSVKKKTEDERKEDEELAKAVNRTLAEEKRKEDEENEKKKREKNIAKDKEDKKNGTQVVVQGDRDEACPICNSTCPVCNSTCPTVKPCRRCPVEQDCPPSEDCPPCEDCRPCQPCFSGTVDNSSIPDCPTPPVCPETGGMSVPVALVVGAMASLLAVGVAVAIGLLLRYVPPLVSGFLFLAIILMVWFFSSHYPETARELGGRVVTALREATIALGHRVMEAIRHHNDQVGLPVNSILLSFDLSSMFH
jgi:hypothetical protein